MRLVSTVLGCPDPRGLARTGVDWPVSPGHRGRDLAEAGRVAAAAGATVATSQPQDDVRVWLDPAGHPFCFFV